MGDMFRMIAALTMLSAASGGILAGVRQFTADRIERQRLTFEKAPVLHTILADAENDPLTDRFTVMDQNNPVLVFPGTFGQEQVVVIEAFGRGYGGEIGTLVGFSLENDAISGVGVTTHSETPGLGSRAKEDPAFTGQFAGISGKKALSLRADGGEIDALTGATVTSRGVCQAVQQADATYQRIKPLLATRHSEKGGH